MYNQRNNILAELKIIAGIIIPYTFFFFFLTKHSFGESCGIPSQNDVLKYVKQSS